MSDMFAEIGEVLTWNPIRDRLTGAEAAKVEGKSAQNVANYNAAVQQRQAKAELARGQFAGARQAAAGQRAQGTLEAALGASGAVSSLGAPASIQAEQAKESELEMLLTGYEAQTRAARALSQSELDKMQGEMALKRSKNEALARQIQFGTKVGTSLLGGF